jgi:hypothetical protein
VKYLKTYESHSEKSVQDTITDIFSNLTDEYPITIQYSTLETNPLMISVNLLPDYSKMGGSSLKLAAIEIEKLKEFTKNYIPGSSIAPKMNPSLKDRFNFLIKIK